MTLKELEEHIKNADMYELLLWVNWFFTKEHSCIDCVATHKVLNIMPRCHKCTPVKNLIKHLEKGIKENEKNKQE